MGKATTAFRKRGGKGMRSDQSKCRSSFSETKKGKGYHSWEKERKG